jgi:hypothetical protein
VLGIEGHQPRAEHRFGFLAEIGVHDRQVVDRGGERLDPERALSSAIAWS